MLPWTVCVAPLLSVYVSLAIVPAPFRFHSSTRWTHSIGMGMGSQGVVDRLWANLGILFECATLGRWGGELLRGLLPCCMASPLLGRLV